MSSILLRADNHGEGGTLALMALAQRAVGRGAAPSSCSASSAARCSIGDAMITPALSVLSAVEGIKLVTPAFDPYVVPLTVVILLVLFAVQSRGTANVAAFFGPIMCIWFAVIAIGAIMSDHADIPTCCWRSIPCYGRLLPASPRHRSALSRWARCFWPSPARRRSMPISAISAASRSRSAGFSSCLPSLALNYLGQGALVLADPKAIENPFFLMFPDWALLPMVALATVATVIASQAVITGAYSLTQQAIQLGLLPRFEIRHTSESQFGQIYMPRVNMLLLIGVLLLVLLFRSSSALASAYGIAVTGTMVVDGMMAFVVMWKVWNWPPIAAAALIAPFLFLDLTFLAANLLKVFEGGWVPLALGADRDAADVYLAPRQPAAVRENTQARIAARPTWSRCWKSGRRSACPAPPCSSPATRSARRPR